MPPVFVLCVMKMEDKEEIESCIIARDGGILCIHELLGSLMNKLGAFIPCLGGSDFLVEDNLQHWENGLQLANSLIKRQ